MSSRKAIYVNQKQRAVLAAIQRRKAFLAGRGGGKTTVAGHHYLDAAAQLPRAKFFLLGLTYNQIQSIFLAPMTEAWARRGVREHLDDKSPGHYVVGKRPPAYWQTPFQKPAYYENQITFFNGFTISMISFDRSDRARGGNYDGGGADECVLINKERYDKEIKPMIRGNIYKFPNNHYHHSELLLSSQSWTTSGDWFPDLEFEAQQHPDDIFFAQGSAYDNIDVLGEKYIKDLERDLPALIFDVEVRNERRKKIANGFYHAFDDDHHCYWNIYSYDQANTGMLVTKSDSKDYDPTLPLECSFDFNAGFNSCIVGQEFTIAQTLEARVINRFYSKNRTFAPVVDDIIRYYAGHKNKVMIWGDRNGNNKQANSELTFYEEILKKFKEAGFTVELMVGERLDPFHALKHLVINTLLEEKNPALPRIRINKMKCKDVILSIQAAPVTGDYQKDKSSERDKTLPQEKATHLSDCFDNWIYPKYNQLIEGKVYSYKAKVIGR